MANWKEKGVVPDSEDEDELDVDTLNTPLDESRVAIIYDQDGKVEVDDRVTPGEQVCLDEELPSLGYSSPSSSQVPPGVSHIADSPKLVVASSETAKSSPILSPKAFKIPDPIPEPFNASFSAPTSPGLPPSIATPAGDGISRSYVRLTSPNSSPLSYPSISPEPRDTASSNLGAPSNSSQNIGAPLVNELSRPARNDYPRTRALRQRKDIQLHPYMLEQEKYRQTLKARGMTPMRLAHTQDEHRPQSRDFPSSDPDSQSTEVVEDAQQLEDVDWNLPSSPPQRHDRNNDTLPASPTRDLESGDEEFPDLHELLDMPRPKPTGVTQISRKKPLSSRSKRQQLAPITSHSSRLNQMSIMDETVDLFDVPASPPPTSPVILEPLVHTRKPHSITMSISSKQVTPTMSEPEGRRFRHPMDLPTPTTSVAKPVVEPILVDSDTEMDDLRQSPLLESSSDESVHFRKIRKRIRGVLPASHLRLDRSGKASSPSRRDHHIDETSEDLPRRGVAVPTTARALTTNNTYDDYGLPGISDDSEPGEGNHLPQTSMAQDVEDSAYGLFDARARLWRTGLAEEDDSVDAMLPSKKRQARVMGNSARKRRQIGSGTAQLSNKSRRRRNSQKSRRSFGRVQSNLHGQRKAVSRPANFSTTPPPRLGILDMMHLDGPESVNVPQFLRVAARTARSKIGKGRQSPGKKFIRLANREDTTEVQSILQDWKRGTIKSQVYGGPQIRQETVQKHTAPHPSGRQQLPRGPTAKKAQVGSSLVEVNHIAHAPRRLRLSTPVQTSMEDFINVSDLPLQQEQDSPIKSHYKHGAKSNQRQPHHGSTFQRPAQLEAAAEERSRFSSESTFKTTKRSFDTVFKALHRRHEPHTNLQLNRFLLDTASPLLAAEPDKNINLAGHSMEPKVGAPGASSRRRKALPLRMDVGAAKYRQPSEPLVLEALTPVQVIGGGDQEHKLQGLGKFGTKYPVHFDILALHNTAHFHESTLIGSGRLAKVLDGVLDSTLPGHNTRFTLGDKHLVWNQWNETVASEIGLCVDWIAERLATPNIQINQPAEDITSVLDFVCTYVQRHAMFVQSCDQHDFLSRMFEILQDFLARLSCVTEAPHAQHLEVMTRCILLVFQILVIARASTEKKPVTSQLESLLIRACSLAGNSLLANNGLDLLRKVYDDLQYFSVRQEGIKTGGNETQSWVVMIRVLSAARISRGSFWDVISPLLSKTPLERINDARILERLWYSLFSLLPLCGFDNFGRVKSSSRHTANFDGWSIPQSILKRLFYLYNRNPIQPSGFNDYVRATLQRCHYLMTEWGWWKCGGVIGTIFDFFASQNLANLRNEEVYDSPQFLSELDEPPYLMLRPEDRSFHIFLKMIALTIQHMKEEGTEKSVRNFITRLLPNHNRRLPKEEEIHHRELASLRNHQDLLSTLYFAAPTEHRPPLSLLSDLVAADRSHTQACLINLRAWENLAKFIVTSTQNSIAYNPFTRWQDDIASALGRQYSEIELDVRSQAESLSRNNKETVSETLLQETINSNKRSTMEMMRAVSRSMCHIVKSSPTTQMTMAALNPTTICTLCSEEILGDMTCVEGLVSDCLSVIDNYLEQIDKLNPVPLPQDSSLCFQNEESQDSGEWALSSLDRAEMIHRLEPIIVPWMKMVVGKSLQNRSTASPPIIQKLVVCWARLVSKMTEGGMNIRDFFMAGSYSIFSPSQRTRKSNIYWAVFLAELTKNKCLEDFEMTGFDIATEWLCVLTMAPLGNAAWVEAVNTLTAWLRSLNHYLVTWPTRLRKSLYEGLHSKDSAVSTQLLFKNAVDIMRTTLLSESRIHSVFQNSTPKQAQQAFSVMLKRVMQYMKEQLESMFPRSEEHLKYMKVVQGFVSVLRSHASELQPLLEFFLVPSPSYWPEDTDPTLYAAGIVSYSLRLHTNPRRSYPELFHYLYNGWKSDVVQYQVSNHVRHLRKAIKQWEFATFLMSEFIPAALHVGFESPSGWVLCASYLPALSSQMMNLLGNEDAAIRRTAFELVINLLRITINGFTPRIEDGPEHILPVHGYCMLQLVVRFWLSVLIPLRQHASSEPDKQKSIQHIEGFMVQVLIHMCQTEDRDELPPKISVTTSEQFTKFVSVLLEDIRDQWEMQEDPMEVVIGQKRARDTTKTRVNLRDMVGEILIPQQMLKLALPLLENEGDHTLEQLFEARPGPDIRDMYW